MLNKIGYACINTTLKNSNYSDCRLNSIFKYGIDYLRNKIINNLKVTKDILNWNIGNNIHMFRVTSRLFPLVTHPDLENNFKWRWYKDNELLGLMEDIRDMVDRNDIRLSMHPDQFTVINSLKERVVNNSIINLRYHYEVLKRLGGTDIIIHTGGVYGDKKSAMERFVKVYDSLDYGIKEHLRLENDDKSYTLDDVLHISSLTSIPIVLDIHHHACNNNGDNHMQDKIIKVAESWKKTGVIPKLHISSGREGKTDKKHHDYILDMDFTYLVELMGDIDFDLMVEAKKKEKAVLKLKELMD